MLRSYLQLIRFNKPIGTLLLLWPTLWALIIAYNGLPPITILTTFCLGVFLTRSAGCAINDLIDSDFDGKVLRTANRPLASGKIKKYHALLISIIFSIIAFILALIFLKLITLIWSIPALIILITYPFFKRFCPFPQMYLGIAFSFGIIMAFLEAIGNFPFIGWLIFIGNFFWVLAYDTIYALVDIEDDLKIGIKSSAITFGKYVILNTMLCYIIFILLLVVIGVYEYFHWIYWLMLVSEIYLIYKIYVLIKNKDRNNCFQAFLINNWIGFMIFIALLANYILHF